MKIIIVALMVLSLLGSDISSIYLRKISNILCGCIYGYIFYTFLSNELFVMGLMTIILSFNSLNWKRKHIKTVQRNDSMIVSLAIIIAIAFLVGNYSTGEVNFLSTKSLSLFLMLGTLLIMEKRNA